MNLVKLFLFFILSYCSTLVLKIGRRERERDHISDNICVYSVIDVVRIVFNVNIDFAFAGNKTPDVQGAPPSMVGGMPVGGGITPQPAFTYRGVWIPFILTIPKQSQTKSV